MEDTIKLVNLETKKTKSGATYWVFETQRGKMSVFELNVATPCMQNMGQDVIVEISEKNGYKNIRRFISRADGGFVKPIEEKVYPSQSVSPQPVVTPLVATQSSEPVYRINLKQLANGKLRHDVTVRADTLEELSQRLKDCLAVAREQCSLSDEMEGLKDHVKEEEEINFN